MRSDGKSTVHRPKDQSLNPRYETLKHAGENIILHKIECLYLAWSEHNCSQKRERSVTIFRPTAKVTKDTLKKEKNKSFRLSQNPDLYFIENLSNDVKNKIGAKVSKIVRIYEIMVLMMMLRKLGISSQSRDSSSLSKSGILYIVLQ